MEELEKALDLKFEAFKKSQNDLAEAQKNNATKEELQQLTEAMKVQGEAFDAFVKEQKEKTITTVLGQFKSFLEENKTELENIKKNRHGVIEFTPKVVGDIGTGNGGDGLEVPPANMNTSLGSFNFRNDNALLSLFSVTSTNSPSLPYTELQPKDGDYAFVAEGGTKPQIDFKWQNYYSTPVKIAAHEVLSEEVVTDIPRLTSVAREYLQKKHDLFKVNALFFADGTGDSPLGATAIARTFTAGGMALKLPLGKTTFMDVVNACITDIYETHNYVDEASYMPNIVLISPLDFFLELVSAKDYNGTPLYPQASLFNQVTIGGVTIKPWAKMPAGKIFVADAKQYHVANYVPFSIRVGWINDQFITNQFTMVGESRFHAYVKNLDKQAFIYDDIATIKTAITAIA
jgi:HK97 family phage major capsid protein